MNISLQNPMRAANAENYSIPLVICQKAEEFLDELDENHPRWEKDIWIFRGQNDANWHLTPPAMRSPIIDKYVSDNFEGFYAYYQGKFRVEESVLESTRKNLQRIKRHEKTILQSSPGFSFEEFATHTEEQIIKNVRRNKEQFQRRVMRTLLHSAIEQHLVQSFSELCDRIGPKVPGNRGDSAWDKPYAYDEILRDNHDDPVDTEEKEYDRIIYALAQHHGLPTRLLDWTYSPTTAAFFAAFSRTLVEVDKFRCSSRQIPPKPKNIIVWAFKQRVIYYTPLRVIKHFRGDIGFLGSQDGLFLYDLLANHSYYWSGKWEPFEKKFAELGIPDSAYRITLPYSQKDQVLARLKRRRVSKPFLMPSFDNVANEFIQERVKHTEILGIPV